MATQGVDDGFFSTPTEKLTTETVALVRNDRPAARPREISSRSSKLNRPGDRRRGAGRIPPHRTRYDRTVLVERTNARAAGFIE